jgi:uncharacterized protein
MIGRRSLLKYLLSAGIAVPWSSVQPLVRTAEQKTEGDEAVIRRYNVLGKTGLRVSDIGFGMAVSTDPKLMVEAYHRGINYYDIIPFYSWSVKMLGKAFALDAEMKKNAVVASKLECQKMISYLRVPWSSFHKVIVDCVETTLKTLGREQIDILQLHSMGEGGESDLDWVDPSTDRGAAIAGIFETLKKQGKIRFAGVTSHGPQLLETAVQKTMDTGKFDMMMVALNFMRTPELMPLLKTAEEKSFGIVAMKVLANAKKMKIKTLDGRPFSQAALAWALSKPAVACATITIMNRKQLIEFLGASGKTPTFSDKVALTSHRILTSPGYCRVGCGDCETSCPRGVPIATLLRIDQYRSDYGLPDFAGERFAELPAAARTDACAGCVTQPCRNACSYGVSIPKRLQTAWSTLSRLRATV